MKIKNISCTQFAGIRDKSISFEDGINIICGKNESGKSTLVNLLSRTLFQNSKIDKRSDKEFRDLYFPGACRGSTITGDFADGKVSFETENGTYTLTKEWGADARCTLSTPDGVIRDQKTIDAVLKEALVYGEGVYSDMLLSSQKNSDYALQILLDASKKTDAKQEITDAVTMAFAESDGVSVDAIEQAIDAKIKEIAGAHWDFERDMPVRKSGRWANGLGEILKAYYELEDARAVLEEISQLESEADRSAVEYSEKDEEIRAAESEFEKFNTFASRLAIQNERREKIKKLEAELTAYTAVLGEWPKLSESLNSAQELYAEKERRGIIDKYSAAKNLADEVTEYNKKTKGIICPSNEDILSARAALRNITRLENKLCGMNLAAQLKMLCGNSVEIKSLRTGELLDISGENISITEAVSITIPGVMEMQLSPADVDTAEISRQLEEQRNAVAKIYEKYKAESVEQMEELAKEYETAQSKLNNAEARLSMTLGNADFNELQAVAKEIGGDIRESADIDNDISELCGRVEISRFITEKETLIARNETDYGSIDGLKAKAFDVTMELEKARASVGDGEDIPAEYLQISDPEGHLEMLKLRMETKRQARENALTAKTTAASRLETYKEGLDGDPTINAENAERKFSECKEMLAHWKHIKEVFENKKNELSDNPMQDISERFTGYLGIISGGKVSSEFPEQDKLNMNIYSDNRLLDYGKLSEGTKETVSLALRLAVLDHLFPDGGGVVVFDDPFTDMDAERTAQSCTLIKDFADRHQVIFLTCKEEYTDALGGNVIRVE